MNHVDGTYSETSWLNKVVRRAGGLSHSQGLMNGNGLSNGCPFVMDEGSTLGVGLLDDSVLVDREPVFSSRKVDMLSARLKLKRRVQGTLAELRLGRSRFPALALVLLVLLGSWAMVLSRDPGRELRVDGDLSDWKGKELIQDPVDSGDPGTDLLGYRAILLEHQLFVYLEARAALFQGFGSEPTVLHLFLDTDLDPETGYPVHGLGANYMLELVGRNNQVLTSQLFVFDQDHRSTDTRARNDWSAWAPLFAVKTGLNGSGLELAFWREEIEADEDDVMLLIMLSQQGSMPVWSLGFNCGLKAMSIRQSPSGVEVLGAVKEEALLTLELAQAGLPSLLQTLTFRETGSAEPEDLGEFWLVQETRLLASARLQGDTLQFSELELELTELVTLTLQLNLSDPATPGRVLSLELLSANCDESAVSISGSGVRAYLLEPPSTAVVDGLFSEWKQSDPVAEPGPVDLQNIDISAVDRASLENRTALYLQVSGQVLAGTVVPLARGRSTVEPGWAAGNVTVLPQGEPTDASPLPSRKGEDLLRVFLDTDANPFTGYSSGAVEIGAEFLVELRGQGGKILETSLLEFCGTERGAWNWSWSGELEAACFGPELEFQLEMSPTAVLFQLVSWTGEEDLQALGVELLPLGTKTRSGGSVLINEIFYGGDSSDHEWVELYNSGSVAVVLDGWSLDDGEGVWTIPDPEGDGYTLDAGGYLILARDGAVFYQDFGFYPNFEKEGDTSAVDLTTSGSLLLANSEDQLFLNSTSTVVDFVAYDISSLHGTGWGVVRWAMTQGYWSEEDGKDFVDTVSSWDSIARDASSSDSDKPGDWSRFGGGTEPSPAGQNIPESGEILLMVFLMLAVFLGNRRVKRPQSIYRRRCEEVLR
jgi:hypothetical protein